MLAVLFGVLAMHGQANAQHHAPAAVAHEQVVDDTSHAQHASSMVTPACDGDCSAGGDGLMALCLAILVAALGFVVVAQAQRRSFPPPRRGPPAQLLPARDAVPRPRDAVAELCISRT